MLAEVTTRCNVKPLVLLDGDPMGVMEQAPFDVRVPLSEYRRLLRRAIMLTGEPGIGIHYGLRTSAVPR